METINNNVRSASDLNKWLALVHCGDCCGMKDPLEDMRQAYVNEILSQPKKEVQTKKTKQAA